MWFSIVTPQISFLKNRFILTNKFLKNTPILNKFQKSRNYSNQSPIAINEKDVTPLDMPHFKFTNYEKKYLMQIVNKGHTVQLNLTKEETDLPSVTGGRLEGNYIFHNIHFHWPSEHIIDGKRYDFEGHLVHFNEKYESLENSVGKEDGVAVLAVMYRAPMKCGCTTVFSTIEEVMENISKVVDQPTMLLKEICLHQFLPANVGKFVAYDGSLTTPDFTENVSWTVFLTSQLVLTSEFQKLRNVYNAENQLVDANCRSVHELHGRPIYVKTK